MTYLLDGNVLVALVIESHVHHRLAKDWFCQSSEPFATCSVAQVRENHLAELACCIRFAAAATVRPQGRIMKVFETTARADGPDRRVLDTPLSELPKGRVKVIVQTEDEVELRPLPAVDFMKALGSAYRDFPDLPRSTTAELMRELREGEE